MPDTIGTRIRNARKEAGLTVRALAQTALGGEQNARQITFWEKDKITPSVPSLVKLAAALNRSVADFIPEPSTKKAS